MQTLLMVRLVTFRLESQPERRGMAGVCPDAQLVLKLVDHQTPAPPGGGCHDVVTNGGLVRPSSLKIPPSRNV